MKLMKLIVLLMMKLNVYNNNQNVHNSNIQLSVIDSINIIIDYLYNINII
jgi:hypothetical protein